MHLHFFGITRDERRKRFRKYLKNVDNEKLKLSFIQLFGVILVIISLGYLLNYSILFSFFENQYPSKDFRWIFLIYSIEVFSLGIFICQIPEPILSFFKDNKWKNLTKFSFLVSLLLGTFVILSLYVPDLPGDLFTINNDTENITIKYQWSSYTQYSDLIIPGNKLCVNVYVDNRNEYEINMTANSSLVAPGGDETSYSSECILGPVLPKEQERYHRKVCVDVLEPGLNTWHIDFNIERDGVKNHFKRHDLFPMVRSHESYFNRQTWFFGALGGLLVFLTLIPKAIKDLKDIWDN